MNVCDKSRVDAPYTGVDGKSRAFQHSMKRRCFVHDYKGRSIYMITLEVAGRRPLLGRIVTGLRPTHLTTAHSRLSGGHLTDEAQSGGHETGEPVAAEIPLSSSGLSEAELKAVNAPLFEPSELGRRVAEEFMKIGEHVPGVKPLVAQAMPDHFHGILFVTREINRSLGSIMAGFKGKCSQIALALTCGAPNSHGHLTEGMGGGEALGAPRVSASASLWEPGYHDRILTSEGQLEKMIRYVIDNPRRAALRLKYRALFTGVRQLTVNGRAFEAYGNGFLLQRAKIAQVQCSRRFFGFKREEKLGLTPGSPNRGWKVTREVAFQTPEIAAKRAALFEAAKNGAVLCSPCISDGEKAIAYAAVDAGYPLIVLRNEPFPPMFKPSGRFFDACAEGRLLMLYPQGLMPRAPDRLGAPRISASGLGGGGHQPARITRAECLALNAIVTEICGGQKSEIVYQGLKTSIESQKLHIGLKRLHIGSGKLHIEQEKLHIGSEELHIEDALRKLDLSRPTFENIIKLYRKFGATDIFGRTEICAVSEISERMASYLVSQMMTYRLIESVTGHGKGKYRFRDFTNPVNPVNPV